MDSTRIIPLPSPVAGAYQSREQPVRTVGCGQMHVFVWCPGCGVGCPVRNTCFFFFFLPSSPEVDVPLGVSVGKSSSTWDPKME